MMSPMKKLLAIITLSLCFMLPSQADDIKDFQIEGISIGDSLLDYLSKREILSGKQNYYKSDEFIPVYIDNYKNLSTYEGLQFHYKKGVRLRFANLDCRAESVRPVQRADYSTYIWNLNKAVARAEKYPIEMQI